MKNLLHQVFGNMAKSNKSMNLKMYIDMYTYMMYSCQNSFKLVNEFFFFFFFFCGGGGGYHKKIVKIDIWPYGQKCVK